jgi:flagellar motor protein MotB
MVALSSVGCQSKVADQRDDLYHENKELRAQLEARNTPGNNLGPAIAPPEQRAPVVAVREGPTTQPARYTITPPAPTAPPAAPMPAPRNDLAETGQDVTTDPVAGTTTVHLVGDALFDPGRATLKETAKAGLDKIAAAIKKQFPGKSVKVQGHTDADPIVHSKWASNMELSKARAEAVRKYLVEKGLDGGSIISEGFGETKPKDAREKSKNRRVEIVVVTR